MERSVSNLGGVDRRGLAELFSESLFRLPRELKRRWQVFAVGLVCGWMMRVDEKSWIETRVEAIQSGTTELSQRWSDEYRSVIQATRGSGSSIAQP